MHFFPLPVLLDGHLCAKGCIECRAGDEKSTNLRDTCPFRGQWHSSQKSRMHGETACWYRTRRLRLRSPASAVVRMMNALCPEHLRNFGISRRMFLVGLYTAW